MAGYVSDSHLAKLSFPVSRPRIPFGWRYMGQNVIIWSAVCSSAPHLQDAVEAMPHYALITERGRLQSGDGSTGPRRVWEAPFQVKGRLHHQKLSANEKCLPAHNAPPVVRPSCCTVAQFASICEQFQSSKRKEVS